jgi:3',5'-cyclic AMP phosphodiesterase CpdA
MKKIIHMSDFHVGHDETTGRFYEIMQKLKTVFEEHLSNYVLVISGDVVDNAHEIESIAAVLKELDDLKLAGLEDILVIPGNHDYGTGSVGDKKFVKLFQQAFYGEVSGYPRLEIIDDVAFFGLDSIAEELHWYDKLWSEGELGSDQLGRLHALLREERVRACSKRVVYLHHHPFSARPLHGLKDAKKLQKVLTEAMEEGISIDALLYGHNHAGESHNGRWGIARCYDAGSATLKPRPHIVKKLPWFRVKSSIRIIDLDTPPEADQELTLIEP